MWNLDRGSEVPIGDNDQADTEALAVGPRRSASRGRDRWFPALLLLALATCFGLLVLALLNTNSSSPTASPDTNAGDRVEVLGSSQTQLPAPNTDTDTDAEVAQPTTTEAVTAPTTTVVDDGEPVVVPPPTVTVTTDISPASVVSLEEQRLAWNPPQPPDPAFRAAADNPVRWAVYEGGKVLLRGSVASTEIAAELEAKAAAVVGPQNVVVEYTIDPNAPTPDTAPLYVADYILFDSGSAEVHPRYFPLLDLGVVLLTSFPDMTMTVIGHTDSNGSEESNIALANERVESVKQYWRERGVPETQLVSVPLGEADPISPNYSEETRAFNRRVEVTITGLLN
jgi:OOP family OmpA-OmpF porin